MKTTTIAEVWQASSNAVQKRNRRATLRRKCDACGGKFYLYAVMFDAVFCRHCTLRLDSRGCNHA